MRLFLVHGGLYEGMTAARFWTTPGVVKSLEALGHDVVLADRLVRPTSWVAEGSHLMDQFSGNFDAILAGSNGCSAAARLMLDHDVETALLLCWPASRSDVADTVAREVFAAAEVDVSVQEALLAGETLRGIADHELRGLTVPVSIIPSQPENPLHARSTAEQLAALIPNAVLRAGFPESPHPLFDEHCEAFVNEVHSALAEQAAR